MVNSVALRRPWNETFTLVFNQSDGAIRLPCVEYWNVARRSPLGVSIDLTCDPQLTMNKSISGIRVEKDFNSLVTVALRDRRLSGHHTRWIDSQQSPISFSLRHWKERDEFFLLLGDSRCNDQGISHPTINQCLCAPGFYGDQCQYSENEHSLSPRS